MRNLGFFRTMTASPEVFPGNIDACLESMKKAVDEAMTEKASLLVLPELCLTSSSCGDLFSNPAFLAAAEKAAGDLAEYTFGKNIAVCFSFPLIVGNSIHIVAALACGGEILGIVPLKVGNGSWKGFKNYNGDNTLIRFRNNTVLFGKKILFNSENNGYLKIRISDGLVSDLNASLVIWPDASAEMIGASRLRKDTVRVGSVQNCCATVYVSSGNGESTSDGVFSGHALVSECGELISDTEPFRDGKCITDIDLELISYRKSRNTTEITNEQTESVFFELSEPEHEDLKREYSQLPFLSASESELNEKSRTAFEIQSRGLAERLKKTGTKKAVIGVSGGLDSTLALLVSLRAAELLGRDSSSVIAVSMPCFGTSSRTKTNAEKMCERLKVDFRNIDISESVSHHLKDIGHDLATADTVYENAQARERTQVLMDIANMEKGIVVGTGDMSEAALGWCTFNGDHMSMYNVNCSIPKTFIREMVSEYASESSDKELSRILMDIVATPISPELKTSEEGDITQKTEEIIGPYDVHDFFLYHFVRNGTCAEKLLRIAEEAFEGKYNHKQLENWLYIFMKRFFASQFKRNCVPDGPAVGRINLSNKGFSFPSDVSWPTVDLR